MTLQVDLSDSEDDGGPDGVVGGLAGGGGGLPASGGGADGQGGVGGDGTMGRLRRGGELGTNKKGTPLYSREDIREQYCINDKELQVLDKSQRRGLLGCFSNQGQVRTHKAGMKATRARSGGGTSQGHIL